MQYVKQKGYLVHPNFSNPNRKKMSANFDDAVTDFLAVIEILNANDVNYCITHGTCLGLIRDHALIPWDFDADIAVITGGKRSDMNGFLCSQFEKHGFTIVKYNLSNTQLGITRSGFIIDLNFYRNLGPLCVSRWHYDFINFKKFMGATQFITWKGTSIAIPGRVLEYLTSVYGRDWRTPKHYNFRFGRVYIHVIQKIWYLLLAFTAR